MAPVFISTSERRETECAVRPTAGRRSKRWFRPSRREAEPPVGRPNFFTAAVPKPIDYEQGGDAEKTAASKKEGDEKQNEKNDLEPGGEPDARVCRAVLDAHRARAGGGAARGALAG